MTLRSGNIDLNGQQLYYETQGDGPAIILIHGNMLDCRMWRFNTPALAEEFQVITYDMRGYGKSGKKPNHIGAVVQDLQALLNHLNIDKAILCGTSMGGVTALHFALLHPGRTNGLVLVDSDLSRFAITGEFAEPIAKTQQALSKSDNAEAVNIWLNHKMLVNVKKFPKAYDLLLEMVHEYDWQDWLSGRGYSIDPPAMDRLDQLTAHTLVMVGQHDLQRFHAIAELLNRQIPNCQKTIIPGASHLPNMETPQLFNQKVLDFARQCTSTKQ